MTYDEALRSLLSLGKELASPRQPARSSAAGARAQKFGLENIRTLAARLGHPQRKVRAVHIAGTNGKGSTAAMLEAILRAAGGRTGLYTSPHLARINERIRIAGSEISNREFALPFERVQGAIESLLASGELAAHPTFFECLTAMAFDAFARRGLDWAVYEVGMGGRLDATNILQPAACVITQIDFDHENFLGHSIEAIASEKAGIIKPGVPVVSSAERGEARAVIANRAKEMGAPLVEIDSAWRVQAAASRQGRQHVVAQETETGESFQFQIPLLGRFQVRNALAAATAARVLAQRGFTISNAAVESGLATVEWPGRLEKLADSPLLYVDGAHNPAAAREILRFWEDQLPARLIFLVYGSVRDKAVDEIAGTLFPRAEIVFLTAPQQPRAISPSLLADLVSHHARRCRVIADPTEALEAALAAARPQDVVFVTGSLYLVGEVRAAWLRRAERSGVEA